MKVYVKFSILSIFFATLGSDRDPESVIGFPEKWREAERPVERARGKKTRLQTLPWP